MRRTLALVTILAAGCTSGLKRPPSTFEATQDAQGVQRVKLDLHSFYFEPNRIVVHSGQPVEIVLHNRAVIVPHNFTIADTTLAISANKWGFGSKRIRFTPLRTGEYPFVCHVDGHAKKGMTGTLVVVP